jgi:hypothetical protein
MTKRKKLTILPENLTPSHLFDSLILDWLFREIETSDKGVFLGKGCTREILFEKMMESNEINNPS